MSNDGTFDPQHALEAFDRHNVQYVLIGGLAAIIHGSPEITVDLDICYKRTQANMNALAAALGELGASLRGAPDGLPFTLDGETFANGDTFTFSTKVVRSTFWGRPKEQTDMTT